MSAKKTSKTKVDVNEEVLEGVCYRTAAVQLISYLTPRLSHLFPCQRPTLHYGTGEAIIMAVPLHSVVCFALGTKQRTAFGDSHVHIVCSKRLVPSIVILSSKQHPCIKRNSCSYSYVVVFPIKKGQTLQIDEAASSSAGGRVE